MKLSIAEVKRRLPVNKEFTGEFIGRNRGIAGYTVAKRRVVRQGGTMCCILLDGPKAGQKIYLDWRGVQALERDGSIILIQTAREDEEFLKITFGESHAAP